MHCFCNLSTILAMHGQSARSGLVFRRPDWCVHVQVKDHIQTINLAPIDTYFMLNCFNNTSGPGFLHRAPS